MQSRFDASPHLGLNLAEPRPHEDKNSRDRALAEWAELLTPILKETREWALPERSIAPSGPTIPRGDARLGEAGAGSQTSDTPVNDPGPSRLVLSVSSETLGQIDLIVDRDQGGVSIAIGAGSEAQALISTDKFTLVSNLSQNGVHVRNLGVMSREAFGTVLAEGRQIRREAVPNRQGSDASPNRPRKRFSLIG